MIVVENLKETSRNLSSFTLVRRRSMESGFLRLVADCFLKLKVDQPLIKSWFAQIKVDED